MSIVQRPAPASAKSPPASSNDSLPRDSTAPPQVTPGPFTVQRYYCSYCNRAFAQVWELEQHTQTIDHRSKVNSDKERQWKYRSPPWGVVNGEYKECEHHKRKQCYFTNSPPDKNTCNFAHSSEELEEWRERHEYRIMKMKKAKEQKLYAFMDEVLEKYNFSTNEMSVITEELPGIHIKCHEELNKFLHIERKEDTTFTFSWKFLIKSKKQQSLKRVGLLYDEHRLHFYLSSPKGEDKPQVCPGTRISEGDGETYHIDVLFHSRMLGSFSQWVLFDFGSEPVLVRKLEIHVGSQEHFETFQKIQRKKQIQTWDSINSEIVKFPDAMTQAFEEKLLATYKPPAASLSIDDIELKRIDRDTYKLHMHKMLHLEEREQTKRIARFSIETTLNAAANIKVAGQGLLNALNGEMYASISLKQALMDDSEASQIIMRSVHKMLLKFDKTNKVYEAIILRDQDYGSQNNDSINLQLSQACASEQNLAHGTTRTVQVQFQLNRLPFCYQHFAVDSLHNMDMVFPSPKKLQRFPYIDADNLQETNFRQERAASFICQHGGSDALPMHGVGPLLVFGPFGTGKTYTLATAVKRTVTRRPLCRILICTRSNSAADWYITEHLHKFVEQTWSKYHIRMIRIYTNYRKLMTIDPIVRPYVLMDENGQVQLPDAAMIRKYQIVITTVAMSGYLGQIDLQGHFTHILVDEAGQTLETEVLLPLSLATSNTCVVLAGDHIQMSPKVFSETARAARFNRSLLERLFRLNVTNAFLTYNYRTCEAILKFIAETYYHEQFKALGNHPLHPEFYPLTFCAVKGEDQHVGMSYVNNHEVLEIVFRAEELCRKWPEKWGKFNKNSIGIISPYSMQVRQIRFEMRRRGLGDIDVETVENVQGKQFRALLISTVRTRSTLKRTHLTVASQAGAANQQDEEFYYGFLSDHKLLNTALTRAQSLVLVAGDPITLCSEGQCSTTWKAFLKECERNNSLQGTSMEEIRQEVEAAKQRLNPFAKIFHPAASKNQTSQASQQKVLGSRQEAGLIKMPVGQNPWKILPKEPSAAITPGWNTAVPGVARQTSEEFPALRSSSVGNVPGRQDELADQANESSSSADDEEDVDLEDAILRELQRQVREDRGELETADQDAGSDHEEAISSENETDLQEDLQIYTGQLAAQRPPEARPPTDKDALIASHLSDGSIKRKNLTSKINAARKLRNVRMVEKQGHLLLIEDKVDRSRLVGADTFEEYDSDEDVEEDVLDENVQQESLEHVHKEPERYKICSFRFDFSGHTYALPKDEDSSLKILITSKRKRGKALNLDEVVVEILEDVDELEIASGYDAQADATEKKIYGKVLCILKRAVNPYLKKIVCTIDKFTDNLMVPIDRTFPKIFAYSRKDDGQKQKTKSKKSQASDFSKVSIYNICRGTDQGFQFQRNVEVSRKDRPNKLFVVQYLKWHARTPYPVGIITEELPHGDTKENGLRILKLVHGIRDKWKQAILDEMTDAFPEDWKIPKEEIECRYDARSRVVFTIDPPESQDLDDALSVDAVEENYFIGIHIADVSYFVKKDSDLDKEAQERATSFYPSFAKPINMLPAQLSNRLCSLLPEEDRLTVSVFVTLDENGQVVGDVKIVRSVIRSRIQLTYDAAEKIIKMTNDETERNSNATIQEKIMTLNKLAKERRRIRLGAGRFAFSHDAEEEEALHPLAHSLVEEMMCLANEAVARFLMMKYPDCAPLRRQLPPSRDEVSKWWGKHGKDILNSVDLQSRPDLEEFEAEEWNDVHVLRETWDKMKVAVEDEEQSDMLKITDIICSDENHPQLAVARSSFFRIQERSTYISSGDHSNQLAKRHHTLKMPSYTHFTSPIRRFFDLVVHRMLTAALEHIQAQNGEGPLVAPYTPAELGKICHHCTNQAINCKNFDTKTRAFLLALKLKEAPQPSLAFVDNTMNTGVGLLFPYRRFIPSKSHNIPLRLLKPIQKPLMEEDASLELVWKHRIYDISGSPSPVLIQPHSVFMLDTRKFIVQISANQWQEILTGIKTEDIYQIRNAVLVATDEQQRREQDEEARRKQKHDPSVPYSLPIHEVTCEGVDASKPSLFINFKRTFDRGDVIKVQLHACSQMGLLTPTVQLFGLTPKFHLCTEHRNQPITSFAEVAKYRPVGIKNISTYKKVWLPIIEMLTAYNAVQSDETVLIHSVKIRWDRLFNQETNNYNYTGFFAMREEFCDDRHFRFNHPPKINKNEKADGSDDPEAHLDYLCIRYSGLKVTQETQLRLRDMGCKPGTMRPTANVHPGKMTFVVHAATIDVTKDKGMILVQVGVTQYSSPFPEVLLSSDPPPCTVELVPKTQPDRRLEDAVRRLDSDRVSPLIRDICLVQKPRTNQDDTFSKLLPALSQKIRSFEIVNSPFDKPNASQNTALRQAVSQPFTVIQGPPGTGKTITGAHLAHFFTVMNRGLPPSGKGPPQVLYCGPSNKSVDVISTYLLKLGAKVVRVYSETIERNDFPIPGEPGTTRKMDSNRDASMDPWLSQISLHHLIRQPGNTRHQNILKWEKMFHTQGYVLKASHTKAYRHDISKAEEEELKKYQIILCTCNAAGSKRIKQFTNVVQCIIDEAGMCNEPETLIPLVSTNPCQVVLIGDHKQLRPIIQEKTAQLLGMEISLLEKYEKKAQMLTMQYRMHEAICEFPSQAFYEGKLETADIVKQRIPDQQVQDIWPGSRAYPVVFCHLYGKEETLTVKTAEGNEQSKSNPQEVKQVVRMAITLVKRLQVKPEKIVILSQYRLQCAEIEDALKREKIKGLAVRTVITSQGSEWDYVIMSTVRSLSRIEIKEKPSVGWKQKNLGFIIDENQMNVALTRARRGLIIVGNQYLLQTHEKWKELIDTCRQHQAVVDARSFLGPR
ncbi:LOW QUALITY PROTEIN: helicase with zinc finger domain 2-like [Acanthaster planci]|uniref:LOW QUALITY PROTEIN: helicase with zinc finger domain 2-like n=1 Tax=Acanthaster planci TaxID=133434 RepID=A0A8B7XH06_ACAPL|nr:LOW QUALITY PROTEIN: helicase with zinc finger domain 2-like [Acanthaster planci]